MRFIAEDDGSPQFGFVDPSQVVRAVHLIPAFRHGRTEAILRPSYLARIKQTNDISSDWESFYVNKWASVLSGMACINLLQRFADRDLFMHYRGGGIGHTTGHNAKGANHTSARLDSALDPRSHAMSNDMEVDAHSVEELVQEVQNRELVEASDEESGDEFADMGGEYENDDSDADEGMVDGNAGEDENVD